MVRTKASVKNTGGCLRTLHIEVPVTEISTRLELAYASIAKKVQLPGFRRGKAPMNLVKGRFRREAEEELLKELVPDAVESAMVGHDLRPVARPRVMDIEYAPGSPMKLTAEVEVRPEIKPKGYKGLRLSRPVREVTEPDLQQVLHSIQNSYAELAPIEGRAAAEDDYVFCDLTCLVEGKVVEANEKQWLRATTQSDPSVGLWAGVLEQLIGAEPGTRRDVAVTLPGNYQKAEFAGKQATIRVAVKELKRKTLPPLDDDLAKMTGQWSTLEELTDGVRQQLAERWRQESEDALRRDAKRGLLAAMSFDVPDSLVESELDAAVADAKYQMLRQGESEQALQGHDARLRKELKASAADRVKLFFALDAIAEEEELSVTDEEWEAELQRIASQSNRSLSETRAWIEEHGMEGRTRWLLLERKVLDFVIAAAKVSEVKASGQPAPQSEAVPAEASGVVEG